MNGNQPPMGSVPFSATPPPPPPMRTMPPASSAPGKSGNPLRIVLFLAILVILAGIAVWFWPGARESGTAEATFLLNRSDGTSLWYRLSGGVLTSLAPAVATSSSGAATIIELSQGLPVGTPALAMIENRSGVRFGLLRPDGSFVSFTGSGVSRRGLSVRPDGLAAFAYVDTTQNAAALSAWRVGVMNVAAQTLVFKDLGAGYAPVFATNGNVLALAPEGFVEIDAETGIHTTLLRAYTDFPLTFAVGPGGSFAIVKNPVTGSSDVFWVNSANPDDISYLGSLTVSPIALGIIDADSFVAQTSPTEATLYSVSPSGITIEQSLSFAP